MTRPKTKEHQLRQRAESTSGVHENRSELFCPVCKESEGILECEICVRWFHPKCANVKDEAFKMIEEHNFHWYCPDCDVAAKELHKKVTALQVENTKLKSDLQKIGTRVTKVENVTKTLQDDCNQTITTKIGEERNKLKEELKEELKDELKAEMQNIMEEAATAAAAADDDKFEGLKVEIKGELRTEIHHEMEDAADDNINPWQQAHRRREPIPDLNKIINEQMHEQKQIDLLKMNLIISGIDETEDGDELERVKTIIDSELGLDADIEKVERCGKVNNERASDPSKPRLLRLVMRNKDVRKTILQNATKLRNSANDAIKNKVYISPDLTVKQQKESKNLRDSLKQTRELNPGKTFKIRKGRVEEVE